jgi:YVTN family beta-propeller protein
MLFLFYISCGEEVIENGIYGTVTDVVTGAPISNAIVRINETTEEENSKEPDGGYRFEELEPGDYTVTVTATGYRSQTKAVHVTDRFVEVNFALERQELIVTPPALVFSSDRTTLALTLDRRSNRTLTWEIDANTIEPWLSVEPLKGEVGAKSSSVAVKLLRERLPNTDEEHNADIVIRSNGGDVTVTVTVLAEESGTRAKLIPQRAGAVFVGDLPFAGPEQIAVYASIGRAFVTNSKANLISVIDIFTDKVIKQIPINQAGGGLKWARSVIANPNRREVYVANYWSGTLSVIDAIEMAERDLIQVGTAPIAIEVSHDGDKLYLLRSPKAGGELVVIDLQSQQKVKNAPIGVELSAIARKGDFLYITDTIKNQVFVVDSQTLSIEDEIPVGAKPIVLAASPNRNFVYVANALDGTVSIVDTVNRRVEETIRVDSQPNGLAVDGSYDDGDLVYVTNSGSRSVSVIDVAKRKVIGDPVTVGTCPIGIAVLSRGDKVYVVNSISDDVSILTVE